MEQPFLDCSSITCFLRCAIETSKHVGPNRKKKLEQSNKLHGHQYKVDDSKALKTQCYSQ